MTNGEAITTYEHQNHCSTTTKQLPAMAAGHPTQLGNSKPLSNNHIQHGT
ncbi:hypothetical protein [Mycolicibacterium iranicum]|uniref:Uncharacterized protein n=1 Tax=Mycolicibacterium iranicum TaxID=912594 RepID=A0ABT4HQ67_MYCIR|nr:hypothetical protein [Mycolicibacterium iranicum]MCZ0732346.1 hypothetical protein [Mycolicibacterium iranicum]